MTEPRVGVATFLIRNGKVLLGKRANSHGDGTWGLPGGHLEFFETFESCAKREVLEETGLDISDISFATATNDIFENENKHYITVFVVASRFTGEPKIMEPNKCLQWEWFSWDNLPEPLFLPLENLKKTTFNPVEFASQME